MILRSRLVAALVLSLLVVSVSSSLAAVHKPSDAALVLSPAYIDFPTFGHTSTPKNIPLILKNTGNTELTLNSALPVEDSCKGNGCGPTGWLAITGLPATIAAGDSALATLTMNKWGLITTGPTRLWGRIDFNFDSPTQTVSMPISYTVADTVQGLLYDSIATSCSIKLAVANNGSMGANLSSNAAMNFRPPVECDTGGNSRGDASTYLKDGSIIIVRKVGAAPARLSYAAYGNSPGSPNGLKPLAVPLPPFKDTTIYQRYYSGQFLTVDSLVKVQTWWYAPKTSHDTCQFIVQKTEFTPNPIGTAVMNLQIGELFDWDIPSDSGGINNVTGFDTSRRLIWTRGFNSADTVTDCWDNSLRYAGSALLYTHLKTNCYSPDTTLHGGYSAANDSLVYPAGRLVPEQAWTSMKNPGYTTEPRITDVHTMLTFKGGATGYTLAANDTLTAYTVMAVVRTAANTAAGLDSLKRYIDKARKFCDFYVRKCPIGCCCCTTRNRGDVNTNGAINLADISALVSYLTGGGYVITCSLEGDLDQSGTVNLGDLSALVSYLTGGGFALLTCP